MPRKTQHEYDQNRLKSVHYNMWMSEGQRKIIKENMKEGNYRCMNDYLIDMGMNGFIITPSLPYLEPIRKCAFELNKIGVNINQIAHRVNTTNVLNDYEFNKLNEDMRECKLIIRQAFDYFLS